MPKLLIVDNEADNVEMMAKRLGRRGYEVIGAYSAQEALERARADHPDLILMDIGMPEVDGHEATRWLKADEATKAIPVIALTAHAMPEDRELALEAGADEYEAKPVDLARLMEKITALLARTGG
jgi:CheY-like chemotaxis protein